MPASSNVVELTSTFRPNEIGSCGKTCRRACWLNLEAHPAQDESDVSLRICSRDISFTSFQSICRGRRVACLMRLTEPPLQKKFGGEDRNRTYLGPAVAGSTTVLKTARTTRHPSLSGLWIGRSRTGIDCGLRKDRQSVGSKIDQEVFLITLTMALKSGQSPESSLE